MVVSASDNPQLLSRWNAALSSEYKKDQVDHYDQLIVTIEKNQADVALIHINLPGLDGLEGLQKISQQFPDLKLFVMSDKPNEIEGIRVLKLGGLGYANSFISVNYLKEAIKVIKMGEVWIGKRLMQWLVTQCTDMAVPEVTDIGHYINLDTLTASERKVSDLLAHGNNNKTIAKNLGITERTVKAHLSSIFRKTGVTDRLHLVLLLNSNQH